MILKPLSPDLFEAIASEPTVQIIDCRAPQDFGSGFVPRAINIQFKGSFSMWLTTLVPDTNQRLLIVAEAGQVQELENLLSGLGYTNCAGYLEGGMNAWISAGKALDQITSIEVSELTTVAASGDAKIIDVRGEDEFEKQHVANAINAPVDSLLTKPGPGDQNETYYVHCGGGSRAMMYASILKSRGYKNIFDIRGGFKAIKESGQLVLTTA